jgi:hypothetical protein
MATDSTSETAIFERVVLPMETELNEAAARYILAIGFGPEDRDRMQVLAQKARDGTLTSDEEQAVDNYERVGHYLAILQSKARLAMNSAKRPGD